MKKIQEKEKERRRERDLFYHILLRIYSYYKFSSAKTVHSARLKITFNTKIAFACIIILHNSNVNIFLNANINILP